MCRCEVYRTAIITKESCLLRTQKTPPKNHLRFNSSIAGSRNKPATRKKNDVASLLENHLIVLDLSTRAKVHKNIAKSELKLYNLSA